MNCASEPRPPRGRHGAQPVLSAHHQRVHRHLPRRVHAGHQARPVPHVLGMQVAPVVDASSSQSRTDVLGIVMSAVLLLTGLQWLSLKPRTMPDVS